MRKLKKAARAHKGCRDFQEEGIKTHREMLKTGPFEIHFAHSG
jgi:hypothetical protein